ncbi:MAG: hypothetical protein E6Q36_05725 [Chryseobacterium sp.]|nr:MAG: hypothetical protein E6Q36_05725 [Chryseobacterium sp.]
MLDKYNAYIESVVANINLMVAMSENKPTFDEVATMVGRASMSYKQAAIMAEMPVVGKSGMVLTNSKSYPYTTEADLYAVLQKLLGGFGLVVRVEHSAPIIEIFETIDYKNKTEVAYVTSTVNITLSDAHTGYSETFARKVWVAPQLGDKAPNAILGHALKYWFKAVFCIETGTVDDPDSDAMNQKPPQQPTPQPDKPKPDKAKPDQTKPDQAKPDQPDQASSLEDLLAVIESEIERTKANRDQIFTYYGVQSADQLTAEQAKKLIKTLQKRQ